MHIKILQCARNHGSTKHSGIQNGGVRNEAALRVRGMAALIDWLLGAAVCYRALHHRWVFLQAPASHVPALPPQAPRRLRDLLPFHSMGSDKSPEWRPLMIRAGREEMRWIYTSGVGWLYSRVCWLLMGFVVSQCGTLAGVEAPGY